MSEKLNANFTFKIRRLDLFTRRLVSSKLIGSYKSVVKGKGLEFAGFRKYENTDDSSLIDWKVSSRLGEPIIREFSEERNLEVFLLIDVSASMVFGSTEKLKNEYMIELASLLSFAILSAGDSLGYAFVSDKLFNLTLPAQNQKLSYLLTSQLLNPEIYGGTYDLESALKKIIPVLKKNAIFIILSDFIGLKGDWQKYLKQASYKFDTIGIMVRDPRDRELPQDGDMVLIADPYTNEQIILDPTRSVRERYRKYVEQEESEIENVFAKSRSTFLKLSTATTPLVPLINFFAKRKKWK